MHVSWYRHGGDGNLFCTTLNSWCFLTTQSDCHKCLCILCIQNTHRKRAQVSSFPLSKVIFPIGGKLPLFKHLELIGQLSGFFFFFLNLSKGRSPSRQRPVLRVFVRSTAQEVSPAAHGRDAGCGCCSAGTSQPPRVTHRRQLAWGSCLGECVPGHGAPQPAETVWGGLDPLALQHWGKDGSSCCPLGLLLWDAPASSSSSAPSSPTLPVFPPMCDYQRMAQPWTCGSPADSRGSVFNVAHGLNPTLFQVHSGKCQVPFEPCCHQWCRCH